MIVGLKEKILELRKQGKDYKFITKTLGCSKATVSFHCTRNGMGGNGKRDVLTEKEIVELNEFYKTHSTKECMKKFNLCQSSVVKYTENKHVSMTLEEKQTKNYERVKSYRQKIKTKAIEYKGGKCERCGYNKCEWALDFHHKNANEKEFSISRYSTLSWDRIKKELDKCIMVCANCHREIHHEEYSKN